VWPNLSFPCAQYDLLVLSVRVKPLKDTVLTKKRNRLSSDSKANTVYCARENLKHIMTAKKIIGKAITDSL
jgi:hypothetical protein